MTGQESLNAALRDRLRNPAGWLVDALPWSLRRCWLAVHLREWPWNVPNECRLVGFRRPPQRVFDYFDELERRESDHAETYRFEVSFAIGPCTVEEANALADALLEMPQAKALGMGAVGMHAVDDEDNPLPWPDQESFS